MAGKRIRAKVSGRWGKTAYVALPGHRPQSGIVAETVELDDLIAGYKGPRVRLDFNADRVLIGIEILVFGSDLRE
jgi:hypothetical protein